MKEQLESTETKLCEAEELSATLQQSEVIDATDIVEEIRLLSQQSHSMKVKVS